MDCEDLPLPPNWESRFDNSTRRWFYVNHEQKMTTWDDPRPSYYSSISSGTTNRTSSQRRTRNSRDRAFFSEYPFTSDSPYSLTDAEYDRTASPRPPSDSPAGVDEDEPGTHDFLSYLNALRASYPDLKERQMARLLEDYLGDSPELRRFIATHLHGAVSKDSSERQGRRANHSNAEQTRKTSTGQSQPRSPITPNDHHHGVRRSGRSSSIDDGPKMSCGRVQRMQDKSESMKTQESPNHKMFDFSSTRTAGAAAAEDSYERQRKRESQPDSSQARKTSTGQGHASSPTTLTTHPEAHRSEQFSPVGVDSRLSNEDTSPPENSRRLETAESVSDRPLIDTLKPAEPNEQYPASSSGLRTVDVQTNQPTDLTSAAVASTLVAKHGTTDRLKPRGPDPSLRVSRVKPLGPNRDLVRGPNKLLVSGSLATRLTDRER